MNNFIMFLAAIGVISLLASFALVLGGIHRLSQEKPIGAISLLTSFALVLGSIHRLSQEKREKKDRVRGDPRWN